MGFSPWGLRGTVVHGQGRGGRRLGFPTANIDLPPLPEVAGTASAREAIAMYHAEPRHHAVQGSERDFGMTFYRRLLQENSNKVLYGWACIEGQQDSTMANEQSLGLSKKNEGRVGGGFGPGGQEQPQLTRVLPMVMSLGLNPHFTNRAGAEGGEQGNCTAEISREVPMTAEVHFISADRAPLRPAFYGARVRVAVLGVLREQEVYANDAALIAAIQLDVEHGLCALGSYHRHQADAAEQMHDSNLCSESGRTHEHNVFNELKQRFSVPARTILRTLFPSSFDVDTLSSSATWLFDLDGVEVVRAAQSSKFPVDARVLASEYVATPSHAPVMLVIRNSNGNSGGEDHFDSRDGHNRQSMWFADEFEPLPSAVDANADDGKSQVHGEAGRAERGASFRFFSVAPNKNDGRNYNTATASLTESFIPKHLSSSAASSLSLVCAGRIVSLRTEQSTRLPTHYAVTKDPPPLLNYSKTQLPLLPLLFCTALALNVAVNMSAFVSVSVRRRKIEGYRRREGGEIMRYRP